MIDWGHKRQKSKCVALNLQPSVSRILTDSGRGLPQLVLKSMLALWALNIKSFKLYYVRIYEPFQNINSALFEVSVKDSSYSSQCVDSTEWLHTSITCDIWMYARDLFFITKTLSLEAVVKEESMNYPRGTTGPCHEPRREERERKGRGKGKHSAIDSGGIERLEGRQKNVSASACDPAHCRLSLCPVNWNTKQSGVDERVVVVVVVVVVRRRRRRRRELLSVSSNAQPSLLAGNWLGNQQARPTHCHW